MLKRKKLAKKQIEDAVTNGDFGKEVTSSKKKVAVILTQSWCPQWTMIQDWLSDCEDPGDLDLYELVYDKHDLFKEILDLKESVWKNDIVPYIRYYRDGKLVHETNYVSKDRFLTAFK